MGELQVFLAKAPVVLTLELAEASTGITEFEIVNTLNGSKRSHWTHKCLIHVAEELEGTEEQQDPWVLVFEGMCSSILTRIQPNSCVLQGASRRMPRRIKSISRSRPHTSLKL